MFEKLKERIHAKTQKNAIKSTLEWTDKKGNVYTELVYLKRSSMPLIGDWGRIYPSVSEDGTRWNVVNLLFGGKKNLIRFLGIFAILVLIYFAFDEIFRQYENLYNICKPYLDTLMPQNGIEPLKLVGA